LPPLDFLIFSFLYCSEINKQTKIIKIVTTNCQILKIKCTKFDFDWGSAPDPAGGAHKPLAEFKEPNQCRREGLWRPGQTFVLSPLLVRGPSRLEIVGSSQRGSGAELQRSSRK